MSRNKMLVLSVLVLSLLASGCAGGEAVTETASQANPNTNTSDAEAAPTTIPEELADVATMQGNGIIVHKTLSYVMSIDGLSTEVRAKRATCFTALSLEQNSGACTDSLRAEFSRMPAPCTLSPKAEAPKTGICSYVAK